MATTAQAGVRKPTAKERILATLRACAVPVATHELDIWAASPISVQRRLYDLKAEGLVDCRRREGKPFMEWFAVVAQQPLLPGVLP